MPKPQSPQGQEIYELDRAHVFHSWSAQAQLDPMVITDAEGPYLYDADGKRYTDLSCQLIYTNMGHKHPKIVEAVQKQAAELCTIAPAVANDKRGLAAKKITDRLPEGINKVMFTNGGADAVENAIRMARLHTGRYKVLSRFRGYHGATHTALTISGDNRRWAIDDASSGAVRYFGPFLYRTVFHSETEEQECARALEHLENLIQFEGPNQFAAFIMESIPGTAGIMPPPANYWKGVREICDRYGIVMICDEVMSGFGRTGAWFAFQHYGVTPDLVTFAKGVNSGYVPMGGLAISDKIAAAFDDVAYPGGLTYSGHPLAMASAVAAIDAMENEGSIANAERLGREVIGPRLNAMKEKHPNIGEVRGLGCFWAIELVADRDTREPLSPYGQVNAQMKEILAEIKDRGVMVFSAQNRLHICPPLNIDDAVLVDALDAIDEALSVTLGVGALV